jgi:peptidyl-prolyl cis-trans isomerase SurA
MKRLFCAALLGLPLLTISNVFASGLPAPKNSLQSINRIVAVVNKDIITQQELQTAMRDAKQQFAARGIPTGDEKKFREQLMEGLIFQKLQLQLAKQNNVKISAEQLDASIAKIAEQNKISIAQLKEKLNQEHITFESFRQQVKEQLIISTIQQQAVGNDIHTTPGELQAFKQKLQQENVSSDYHIVDYLVSLPTKANSATKSNALQTAKNVVENLRENKNVVGMTNVQVNDLSTRPLKDLPDLFATEVVKMHEGAVSNPLMAGNGYHILKLVGVKSTPLNIGEQQIQQLFMQNKFQEAVKKWLDNLRLNAYVKVYD